MRGKIKATLILLTLAILYCCQKVYTRTLDGVLALASEGEGKETLYAEIKGYQLVYDEPDGKNGYYISVPRITLRHQDEGLITKYRFTNPAGECDEGELSFERNEICWKGLTGDGTYSLELWMEKIPRPEPPNPEPPEPESPNPEPTNPEQPESGSPDSEPLNRELISATDIEEPEEQPPEYAEEELKKWSQNFSWRVDSVPPEIQIISPLKQQWYSQEVLVQASAQDHESGVSVLSGGDGEVSCQSGGGQIQFKVKRVSTGGHPVGIWLAAEDKAGNRREETIPVYIDRTSPALFISGADNYLISGRDLELTFTVQEENICKGMEVLMEQENPEGERSETRLSEWKAADDGYVAAVQLNQDGIYRFHVSASDAAGNRAEKYRQVIVDKTNPIIRFVELFQGKWVKEFCWNYEVSETIEDFTTYTYHLELDGRLYTPGQRVFREGRHILRLSAQDSAGNEAFSTAEFMIDNTPPVILCEEQEGQKITDGQHFEKEAAIQIRTENAEDSITEIRINGKKQNISEERNVYSYSLDEEKSYEIMVSATDKAGNEVIKELGIQIVREKSLAERVAEPVKQIFANQTQGTDENIGKSKIQEEEGNKLIIWIGLLIAVCAGGAGIFLGWRGITQKDSP